MTVALRWHLPVGRTVAAAQRAARGDVRTGTGRLGIALEIGGDDAAVVDGTEGRIKLFEATEQNRAGESQQPRLLATLHGTWHRRPGAAPRTQAITFEILAGGAALPHWRVNGFVPECTPLACVDHFVLYFVNRQFPICFPFFVDSNEGNHVEIVAVAERGATASPTEIARTPVLNLPISRRGEVQTTTSPTDRYTDDLVGVTVLHHRHFLIDAVRIPHGQSWPSSLTSTRMPLSAVPGRFQQYGSLPADRRLKIVLSRAMFSGFLPGNDSRFWSAPDIQDLPPNLRTRDALGPRVAAAAAQQAVDLVQSRLRDAGFTDAEALFREDLQASSPLAALHDGANSGGTREIPFFHFVVQSGSIRSVGTSERVELHSTQTMTTDNQQFDYLLNTTQPIGGATKRVASPIFLRMDHFARLAVPALPSEARPRRQGARLTEADFDAAARKAGKSVGTVILHEVGHSLGLMHEAIVLSSRPPATAELYTEDVHDAAPVSSIMCSASDGDPIDLEPFFSNQAKLIWQECFGVTPSFSATPLQNLGLTGDFRTTDWHAREQVIWERRATASMVVLPHDAGVRNPYAPANDGSPFDDAHTPNPQPGTFRP